MDTTLLMDLLTTPRPHGGPGIDNIINKYFMGWERDVVGNLIYQIGESPRTLFSAHIDTVHGAKAPLQQKVAIIPEPRIAMLADENDRCLGADDAAGVFILDQMVKAGIEGLYVIHVGEEVGGIGSAYIASDNPRFLDGIDHAIAFDRRGVSDVITHQGARCCSDEFAIALAEQLNKGMPPTDGSGAPYSPNPNGVFTDTANYTYLVPECTNVSCGYEREHSNMETLNIQHVENLIEACLKADWGSLPVKRDPSSAPEEYGRGMRLGGPHGSLERLTQADIDHWVLVDDLAEMGILTIDDMVEEFPDIAKMIIDGDLYR